MMLKLCLDESIGAIIPLFDYELGIMAKHKADFSAMGVTPIVSDYDKVERCSDKYAMYQFMLQHGYPCARTYLSMHEFQQELTAGRINFPVFVKLRRGYGGLLAQKIYCETELFIYLEQNRTEEFLIQEFMNGNEYGVDCYVDLINKKVVSIFAKEKLAIRSGSTDKAVSRKDEQLFDLIEKFILHLGLVGPLYVDLFKRNGNYYIGEVNPHFGAGYLHAHGCGVNFPVYIRNNLQGITNKRNVGNYQPDIFFMTYESTVIKSTQELRE